MKKMQSCDDCGFLQERSGRCESCDSISLKSIDVHDNEVLKQEQMLNSFVEEGGDPVPSQFKDAESLDFLGVNISKEDSPILFDWALKNAATLEAHIIGVLEKYYENDPKQIYMVIINSEDDLAGKSEKDRQKWIDSLLVY